MKATDSEARPPEIIIVRRGRDDEDEGHHGGVWKIAFADFMTAMMCFFLVMWLLNAANEQVRASLASYFNPVKLVDRNTSSKGLEEVDQGPLQPTTTPSDAEKAPNAPAGARDRTSGPADSQNATNRDDTRQYSDESFFSDPYAVLAEIAAEIGRDQNISRRGEGGQQEAGPSSGASGGEAYRDPFAPDFWSQQVAVPNVGVEGDPDDTRGQPAGPSVVESEMRKPAAGTPAEEPASDAPSNLRSSEQERGPTAVTMGHVPQVELLEGNEEKQAEASAAALESRERTAEEIRSAIAKSLQGEGFAAAVTVTSGERGVLISVTDDMRHGMFSIGSAVPAREMVLAMEKIGQTLAAHPGTVRIQGHTDGRPFAGDNYDNWRLSTARAHAAQYMLIRGGLDETRITEVAGFADRRLKVPDNPLADTNRRIEILLEVPQ